MQAPEDSARWERLKALFGEALDAGAAGRAGVVERARREDAELAAELAALLEAHDRDEGLMAAPTLAPRDWGAAPAGGEPLPQRLGRYEVLGLLGSGGMGRVYLARDPLLGRDVALKVLPEGLARTPQRRAQLLREARAAAGVNHPNIATLHAIEEADGRDLLAFEHVPGRTLRERLAEGPLPLAELLALAVPLAEALAAAHARGIVHRDIKPANVMVTPEGAPKLLDFGLATGGAAGGGEDGLCGTPAAMSPEQARGAALDARSDVFAFGALLHELATGRPAFSGRDVAQVLEAVQHSDPPPLRTLRRGLPRALEGLVSRTLHKDPARRPQGMSELAAELRALARREATRPARRAALLAAPLLLAALAWWRTREPAPDPPPRPELLAVLGFETPADSGDSEHLGAMLQQLLTAHLAAGQGAQVLSPQLVHDTARQCGAADGRVGRALAGAVARRAGLGTALLGQVLPAEGGLLASVEITDVASGRVLATPRARGRGAGDVFAMAEDLARQVREALRGPVPSEDERAALAQQLTTSVEAYRAYVRGLEALLRDDPDTAFLALAEATQLDPAFALAHLRQGMAAIWSGRREASEVAFERAMAFRERLPETLRLMLDALRPYYGRDDTRGSLPILLQVLERDPRENDALYMAAEIYTHSATRADPLRAAEMLARLLEIDPGLSLVYEHLLTAWLRAGRIDDARACLQDWRARQAPNLAELEAVLALWEGRLDAAGPAFDDPLAVDWLAGRWSAPSLSEVLEQGARPAGPRVDAAGGWNRVRLLDQRAAVLAAHGRCDEALELLALAAAEPGFVSPDGFLTSLRNAARQHRAQLLLALGDAAGARAEVAATLESQPDAFHTLSFAGHVALATDDAEAARAHLALLQELCGRGWGPSATLHRDVLQAELHLHEGRAPEARAAFEGLLASGRLLEDWYVAEDSIGPRVRAGLARACEAAGDTAGAASAWAGLRSSGLERLRQPVPWVQAHFEEGRLLFETGRRDEGRALLQRFLELWGGAARPLPGVEVARRLLAG